jgi:hypothetical protein
MQNLISSLLLLFISTHLFAASMLHIDKKSDGCKIFKVSLPSKKSELLFSMDHCPTRFEVSDSGKIYFNDREGNVFEGHNNRVEKIGTFKGWDFSIRVDSDGRPVIGYVNSAKEKTHNNFDGKQTLVYSPNYKNKDETYDVAIAEIYEGGTWRRLEVAPTKSEACDAPGISVLKTLPVKRKVIELSFDYDKKHPLTDKLFDKKDVVGEIKTSSNGSYLFKILENQFQYSPLYFVPMDSEKKIKLIDNGQLFISAIKDYIIVENDEVPKVFDNKGNEVFKAGAGSSLSWLKE